MKKLLKAIRSAIRDLFGFLGSIWDLLPKGFGKKSLFFFTVGTAIICGLMLQIILRLPDVSTISSYMPSETTEIYSADGVLLTRLHQEENRVVIALSNIPKMLQTTVIVMEDENFYNHHGFDLQGIVRAFLTNIVHGRLAQGGSTITQQLARNLFLTKEKTFTRKIAEIILAIQIERHYTKDEILELYMNQIYWGHNAYGVESASNLYFNKHASDLDLGEAALLVGIMDGPELYSPFKNMEGAKLRQTVVLEKLKEKGLITEKQALYYELKPIKLAGEEPQKYGYKYPYFTSYVISELISMFGEEMVYTGGLRVYTTLDTRMQNIADYAVHKFVSEEGEAYNFSEAALISIDPRTGYIKAVVGGISYEASEFNRATQALRQPGSSFKPYVYTAALELGFSPGTIIEDSPVSFEVPATEWNPTGIWSPRNFDQKFRGNVSLKTALANSLNVPSVKLLDMIGVQPAINVARKMGIKSPLKRNLALTLGASEITLMEHTSAFGVFANSGIRVEPTAILRVETRDGTVLYKHVIREKRVLDQNINATMVYMMQAVINEGTGVRGKLADRPAAAKTGTSQEYKDAWFIGYVPQLVTGVWIGNDNNTPMEGVTEVAVCPRMWKTYMDLALAGVPSEEFPAPEGLVAVKICLDSGQVATDYCPPERVSTELYWWNKVPEEKCAIHSEPEWLWSTPVLEKNKQRTSESQ